MPNQIKKLGKKFNLCFAIISVLLIWSLLIVNGKARAFDEDEYFMLEAVYFEARGEPVSGQRAILDVIKARVKSKYWPNTIKGVVTQNKQFSYRNNRSVLHKFDIPISEIRKIIPIIIAHRQQGKVKVAADHYLRCDIKDKISWTKKMRFVKQIGAHCFYKWEK